MKVQQLDSKVFHIIKNIRIAVLVLGTAILFYACADNDIEQIQAFISPEELPINEAIDFETLSSDSGQIRYSLKAPKLLRFENGGKAYVEFPTGMQLIKYDEKQQIISSISADYAKEFVTEKKWEAKNNVVVTNADGDTLKTEHLIWEEKTEKIYTEEYVRIIRDNQIITGLGMTSDQNMTNWRIKNPRGTIYVDVKEQNQNTEQPGDTPISPDKDEKNKPQPVKFN